MRTQEGNAYGRKAPTYKMELTEVGPGTPMGELLRRYWHPVGLSGDATSTPKRVRVLGEDLILFRADGDRVGLVEERCAHRGSSLYYGKVEQGGIRCCYHGWLCRIMVTWGLLSAFTAFATGPTTLAVIRFLLGAAEAGFLPGVIYYLSTWMPARERGTMISSMLLMVPLSNIIGAPISGHLLQLDGVLGLGGWQWVMIAEGVPTVLVGILLLAFLPDSPQDVSWLSRKERDWLEATISQEQEDAAKHGGESVRFVFGSPTVWLLGLIYLANGIGLFGIGSWLPTLIGRAGYPVQQVGYVIAAIYCAMAVIMVLWAKSSDRSNERIWHLIVPGIAGITCLVIAWFGASETVMMWWVAAAIVLLSPVTPLFWNLPPLLLSRKAAAAGFALISSVGALGAFLGPLMIGLIKDSIGNFSDAFLFLCIGPGAAVVILLFVKRHSAFRKPRAA